MLDLFNEWWARQPVRVGFTLAAEAATVVLQPIAQRHPYRLVAGAAVLGAIVVLIRPWRWVSTPAVLSGLLPQLISQAMQRMPAPVSSRAEKAP